MKKLIIIAVVFAVALGGAFYFYENRPQTPSTPLPPPGFPPPALTRPDHFINIVPTEFPKNISKYEFVETDTIIATELAKNLKFSGSPSQISEENTTLQYWTQNQATLITSDDPFTITYTSGTLPGGQIEQSSQDAISQAYKFLESLKVFPQAPITLGEASIRYYSAAGNVQNQLFGSLGANVIEVNYQYTLENLPLFDKYPDLPSITVRLNANGEVLFMRLASFGKVIKNGTIPVVEISEVSDRVTKGDGVLVTAYSDQDRVIEEGIEYKLESVDITKAVLGYYYTADQKTLTPIFVFHGEGYDRVNQRTVKTTTVASALP